MNTCTVRSTWRSCCEHGNCTLPVRQFSVTCTGTIDPGSQRRFSADFLREPEDGLLPSSVKFNFSWQYKKVNCMRVLVWGKAILDAVEK